MKLVSISPVNHLLTFVSPPHDITPSRITEEILSSQEKCLQQYKEKLEKESNSQDKKHLILELEKTKQKLEKILLEQKEEKLKFEKEKEKLQSEKKKLETGIGCT